jgi:hypothetical protein
MWKTSNHLVEICMENISSEELRENRPGNEGKIKCEVAGKWTAA